VKVGVIENDTNMTTSLLTIFPTHTTVRFSFLSHTGAIVTYPTAKLETVVQTDTVKISQLPCDIGLAYSLSSAEL